MRTTISLCLLSVCALLIFQAFGNGNSDSLPDAIQNNVIEESSQSIADDVISNSLQLDYTKPEFERKSATALHPTDEEFEVFVAENPDVTVLRLHCDKLTSQGMSHLEGLGSLERLSLNKMAIPLTDVPISLRLRSLLLNHCEIHAEEFECLEGHYELRRITLLEVSAPENGYLLSPRAFVHIAKIPRLYTLSIYGCEFDEPLDDETCEAIASLNGPLKELIFDKFSTHISAEMIEPISKIESLERLELGECPHLSPEDFEPLLTLPNLREYDAEPYYAYSNALNQAHWAVGAHASKNRDVWRESLLEE